MDANRFDAVVRAFSGASRRGLARALLGTALIRPAGILAGMGEAAAKKQKKKTTFCLDGQMIQASKKQKKKLLKSGATPGACPTSPPPSPPPGCTPDCSRKICGDDGCGSTCGECGLCQECRDGRCEPKANGVSCEGGCRECQGGQCVNKPNESPCPEGGFAAREPAITSRNVNLSETIARPEPSAAPRTRATIVPSAASARQRP